MLCIEFDLDPLDAVLIQLLLISTQVSIYMYNRFGAKETFKSFLYSWYKNMHYYRESGEMEEWYTPVSFALVYII